MGIAVNTGRVMGGVRGLALRQGGVRWVFA